MCRSITLCDPCVYRVLGYIITVMCVGRQSNTKLLFCSVRTKALFYLLHILTRGETAKCKFLKCCSKTFGRHCLVFQSNSGSGEGGRLKPFVFCAILNNYGYLILGFGW